MRLQELTLGKRSDLRARAHALRPLVMIGNDGLTAAVVREIDGALKAHALVKIRVGGDSRVTREALMGEICARTGAALVQHIGKVVVVYRERPPEEAPPAPRAKRPAAREPAPRRPATKKPLARRRVAPTRSARR